MYSVCNAPLAIGLYVGRYANRLNNVVVGLQEYFQMTASERHRWSSGFSATGEFISLLFNADTELIVIDFCLCCVRVDYRYEMRQARVITAGSGDEHFDNRRLSNLSDATHVVTDL